MTGYAQGVRVERAVIADLQDHGWSTVRAASSKGAADVVAFALDVALVNVKRTTAPGPMERAELYRCATRAGCIPVVALGPVRALTYRRLTGVGPRDWVAWTPEVTG